MTNFRSAFNGFHREDVVHYIEYLNAKHSDEVNQLNGQLEDLRAKLEASASNAKAQIQLMEAEEKLEQLQEQLAAAQAENEQLRGEKEQLASALETELAKPAPALPNRELEERCAALERQLQAAIAAQAQAEAARDAAAAKAAHCRVEQELEAYRRAERTERVARERAEQVYRQANGALADATVKVDDAFCQIGELTDQVSAQLALLQTAVRTSKQALADAAATLYTIRPGDPEE